MSMKTILSQLPRLSECFHCFRWAPSQIQCTLYSLQPFTSLMSPTIFRLPKSLPNFLRPLREHSFQSFFSTSVLISSQNRLLSVPPNLLPIENRARSLEFQKIKLSKFLYIFVGVRRTWGYIEVVNV